MKSIHLTKKNLKKPLRRLTNDTIIGYAISDIHFNNWPHPFETRLGAQLQLLRDIAEKASLINGGFIVNCGDLFNSPMVNPLLYTQVKNTLDIVTSLVPFITISGNHDMVNSNTKKWGTSIQHTFVSPYNPNFTCLDHLSEVVIGNTRIVGYPYRDFNSELRNDLRCTSYKQKYFNILLMHTGLPGALQPEGTQCDYEGIPEDFKDLTFRYQLVLCGHIHKPQKLGKNIYMLGSPVQTRRSDMGCTMGYWAIHKTGELEFIPSELPEYREGEDIKDGNYYLPPQIELSISKGELLNLEGMDDSADLEDILNTYINHEKIDDSNKKNALKRLILK